MLKEYQNENEMWLITVTVKYCHRIVCIRVFVHYDVPFCHLFICLRMQVKKVESFEVYKRGAFFDSISWSK